MRPLRRSSSKVPYTLDVVSKSVLYAHLLRELTRSPCFARFLEANELPKMKINLQTDERAKAFFAEIGMPKGPEGNDTAYAIKKHPVIQMMRKEWSRRAWQRLQLLFQ